MPLSTPTDRRTWKELIPGSENVLGTLHVVDGHLVLADLVDCYSRLRVFDVQGHLKGEIKMPGHGSMSAINFVVPNMIDMFAKGGRSEEHTSELQSLMRISYAVFCLKKK